MTDDHTPGSSGPPAGYYRAVDGRDYPVPPGHVLGADGQFHQVISPGPAVEPGPAWTWNKRSTLTVGGAAAVFIGAFLPWVNLGFFSAVGTDGDGVLTLILSIGVAAMAIPGIRSARSGLLIGALICSVLMLAIGIYHIVNISGQSDPEFGLNPSVGGGLYLTVIGGIAALVGVIFALRNKDS